MRPLILTLLAVCMLQAQPAAKFPTSVASWQNLGRLSNRVETRLADSMSTSDYSLTVQSTTGIFPYTALKVNDEYMMVCTISGKVLTICPGTRGLDGSLVSPHPVSAIVTAPYLSMNHNQLASEVIAIQNALGPSLNNVLKASQLGVANGVASLGSDGKVPSGQLPAANGSGAWGGITGDIDDQEDLIDILDSKQATAEKNQVNGYPGLDENGLLDPNQVPVLSASQIPSLAISKITGLQAALDGKQSSLGFTPENVAQKGQPSGYASLGSDGKVPSSQLPAMSDGDAVTDVVAGEGILVTSPTPDTRQMAADPAQVAWRDTVQGGADNAIETAGTSTALTGCPDDNTTPGRTIDALVKHQRLWVVPHTNGAGGSTTINICGLGAKAVKQSDGSSNPTSTQIASGRGEWWSYDGAVFRLPPANLGGGSGLPYIESSTASDTYVMTSGATITSLAKGDRISFRPTAYTNVGASSLDVDGVGPLTAKNILTSDGQTLTDALLSHSTGQAYDLEYDGTAFRLMYSDRQLPPTAGYQYARLWSPDNVGVGFTFVEGTPSGGPTAISSTAATIDCSNHGSFEASPTSSLILASTPTMVSGQFPGQKCSVTNVHASNTLTIKNGSSFNTCIGSDVTLGANGGSIAFVWTSAGCWARQQSASTSSSSTPLQGYYLNSQYSASGQVALSAADKIKVQSIYVPHAYEIRRLIGDIQATDSAASLCLYSWTLGSSTATLVASTSPSAMAITMEDRVITQGSYVMQPGWYLHSATGHQGTLSIRLNSGTVYYTPVDQEFSTGNTDGSCPATLSGINTSWQKRYELRLGWRY